MGRVAFAAQWPVEEVYVIFRVHNLGKENMGVRIYLDPESLRVQGQLEFSAESYSVVPSTERG
jgi:hypothetical protein